LSVDGYIPGTKCPGENATCSVSAKKLSTFLFRTIVPTGISG
jgi:hypothetical protein